MIVLSSSGSNHLFQKVDLTELPEKDFQQLAKGALSLAYPNYTCIDFHGSFELEGRRFQPDMALIAKDFSHWFAIEVELSGHSLTSHVLPQVRAFSFGQPQSDCADQLARGLKIDIQKAHTIAQLVPYSVAVVVDDWKQEWFSQLSGVRSQLIEIGAYRADSSTEQIAFSLRGRLHVADTSLGFGTYYETDNSLQFAKSAPFPSGDIQIVDSAGRASNWTVRKTQDTTWLTCLGKPPALRDRDYVQIRKTIDGHFVLVIPQARVG